MEQLHPSPDRVGAGEDTRLLNLPFLDITAPGFSTRGPDVLEARDQAWCARTPLGLAVLRHRQAGLLLRDRRLRQGSYAWPRIQGLEGAFAEFWQRSIISQEGAPHKALRRIAQEALAEAFILSLKDSFCAVASDLVATLDRRESFDFVECFSEPYAGRAIALLLGLPPSAAGNLARDASTLGLAMGLGSKRHEAAANAACTRLMALSDRLLNRVHEGEDRTSFVARLVDAARRLEVEDHQVLKDLIVISIFGGVDTTRAQLAFAMATFAAYPDQWTWLRDNRPAIPQAVEEVIRTRPTTTWSTREALESFSIDGVDIRAGETIHIFVHATGTDPLAVSYEGFDIREPRKGHFGFGGGAHHCLGAFVARTDMAAALEVLLDNWSEIVLADEPEYLPDSGNTSPRTMPLKPVWT